MWLSVATKTKPRFMNQRSRLKSVAGRFARHLLSGKPSEFGINLGDQFPSEHFIETFAVIRTMRGDNALCWWHG